MKKRFSILLLTSMFLLGGCATTQQNYQTTPLAESQYNDEDEKQGNDTEAPSEDNGSPEVSSENNTSDNTFAGMSESQLAELPDKDKLAKLAASALESISVDKIADSKSGNYREESSVITIDLLVDTGSKNVLLNCTYPSADSNPEWKINSIIDANTKHYYYVPEELKDTVDLYDYATDTLVFKKK